MAFQQPQRKEGTITSLARINNFVRKKSAASHMSQWNWSLVISSSLENISRRQKIQVHQRKSSTGSRGLTNSAPKSSNLCMNVGSVEDLNFHYVSWVGSGPLQVGHLVEAWIWTRKKIFFYSKLLKVGSCLFVRARRVQLNFYSRNSHHPRSYDCLCS